MRLTTTTAVIFVAAAQSAFGISISSQCSTALGAIARSPDAACLNPSGLQNLVLNGATSNVSLVPAVTTYLNGFCGASDCSNDTLAAVVKNVTTGCQQDLSALSSSIDASTITPIVQKYFKTFKDSICLKTTSNDTLCAIQGLNNVQAQYGNITLSTAPGIISQILGSSQPPKNIVCTDCFKGVYNTIKQDSPELLNQDAANSVSQLCGANFVDGQQPSGIVAGVGAAAPTGTGGISGGSSKGAGISLAPTGGILGVVLTFMGAGALLI